MYLFNASSHSLYYCIIIEASQSCCIYSWGWEKREQKYEQKGSVGNPLQQIGDWAKSVTKWSVLRSYYLFRIGECLVKLGEWIMILLWNRWNSILKYTLDISIDGYIIYSRASVYKFTIDSTYYHRCPHRLFINHPTISHIVSSQIIFAILKRGEEVRGCGWFYF